LIKIEYFLKKWIFCEKSENFSVNYLLSKSGFLYWKMNFFWIIFEKKVKKCEKIRKIVFFSKSIYKLTIFWDKKMRKLSFFWIIFEKKIKKSEKMWNFLCEFIYRFFKKVYFLWFFWNYFWKKNKKMWKIKKNWFFSKSIYKLTIFETKKWEIWVFFWIIFEKKIKKVKKCEKMWNFLCEFIYRFFKKVDFWRFFVIFWIYFW
jgi:hypothetical protein